MSSFVRLSASSRRVLVAMSLSALCFACNADSRDTGDDDVPGEDYDGDGSKTPADCNDHSAGIHPGAEDICNGVDDDCSGRIDELFDTDLDGFATCGGDCDDGDNTRFPGAIELANGVDEDCDGAIDDNLLEVDDDGDGFSEVQGDCDDNEPLINPGAVEVPLLEDGTAEGADNDCNGLIDEALIPCDTNLSPAIAMDVARSMELCKNVTNATWKIDGGPAAHYIATTFGALVPRYGANMGSMSTGSAGPAPNNSDVTLGNNYQHPDPQPGMEGDLCNRRDEMVVNDYTELLLEIDVPSNANSFSYDFNFMSREFPEFVCTQFDDTFMAILESQSFNGNISFDAQGRPVTINIGFFNVCEVNSTYPAATANCTGAAELAGTGYGDLTGGGTGWLTTTAPVTPGEKIKLRFIIFDEGDHIFDSEVLLDNFRWYGEPVEGPITEG